MSTPEELEARIQIEKAQIAADEAALQVVEQPQLVQPADDHEQAMHLTKSILFPQTKE